MTLAPDLHPKESCCKIFFSEAKPKDSQDYRTKENSTTHCTGRHRDITYYISRYGCRKKDASLLYNAHLDESTKGKAGSGKDPNDSNLRFLRGWWGLHDQLLVTWLLQTDGVGALARSQHCSQKVGRPSPGRRAVACCPGRLGPRRPWP